MRHCVIFVTRPEMKQTVDYAPSLEDALGMARESKGASASVNILPNGISVIVKHS